MTRDNDYLYPPFVFVTDHKKPQHFRHQACPIPQFCVSITIHSTVADPGGAKGAMAPLAL